MTTAFPAAIEDEVQLEEILSAPTPGVVEALGRVEGDFLILGASGKMGPSLARMIRRATEDGGRPRRIIAVSRFSGAGAEQSFQRHGIETIAGDLRDERFLAGLPKTANVVFMVGAKFGTSQDSSLTWATNVWLPSMVCRRFAGSRILAFSTGNVYPLVPVASRGCRESDALVPVGEYGMSALGRERMFEYFSQRDGTPVSIIRLNYAVEPRYGVIVDLAKRVQAEQPIDLSMGYANVIWQGDANAFALSAFPLATSPPFVLNVAGPEVFAVRDVCERLGELLGNPVRFVGEPAETALLNNPAQMINRFGPPQVALDQLLQWTADWLSRGQLTWSKPTHFEVRDGKF